jgi:hypothetical protein
MVRIMPGIWTSARIHRFALRDDLGATEISYWIDNVHPVRTNTTDLAIVEAINPQSKETGAANHSWKNNALNGHGFCWIPARDTAKTAFWASASIKTRPGSRLSGWKIAVLMGD